MALTDIDYMGRALELARLAEAAGEVPVGALIVRDGLKRMYADLALENTALKDLIEKKL